MDAPHAPHHPPSGSSMPNPKIRRQNNRFMLGASILMLGGLATYYYYKPTEKRPAAKRFTLVTPTGSHGPKPSYYKSWNNHPNASRSNNKGINQTKEVHGVTVERSGGGL